MNKELPKLILGLLLFFGLMALIHPNVFAGHPPYSFGFYCDAEKNQVWEDVYYEPEQNLTDDQKHQLKQQCEAGYTCIPYPPPTSIYSQNAICQKIDQLVQGDGTKIHAPTGEVKRGTPVQIGVSMDFDCFQRVQTTSVRNAGLLGDCQMESPEPTVETHCGCEMKHIRSCHHDDAGREICDCNQTEVCDPDDWPQGKTDDCGETTGVNPYNDGKRCYKNITCQTNPTKPDLDVPLVTDNISCNNHIPLDVVAGGEEAIQPTQDCVKGTHILQAPVKDINNNIAPSLSDDQTNAEQLCQGTVPAELCKQAHDECLQEQKDTSQISLGIKKDDFPNLLCNSVVGFAYNFVGHLVGGNWCIKPTILGGTPAPGQTDNEAGLISCYNKKVVTIAKSLIPQTASKSAVQDCSEADVKKDNNPNSPSTQANRKFSEISAGAGTPTGYLRVNSPNFPCPTDVRENLFTEDKILDGDNRAPDLNASDRCNIQAYFPQGINGTNGTTNPPPPPQPPGGVAACQQVCFATETQCENDNCASKTGHDHDNCVNDCVQAKDHCISQCGS